MKAANGGFPTPNTNTKPVSPCFFARARQLPAAYFFSAPTALFVTTSAHYTQVIYQIHDVFHPSENPAHRHPFLSPGISWFVPLRPSRPCTPRAGKITYCSSPTPRRGYKESKQRLIETTPCREQTAVCFPVPKIPPQKRPIASMGACYLHSSV